MFERQHDRIANHVVDEVCAGGGGITEPGCLYGGRSIGEQLEAAVAGVSLEVDDDVELVAAHAFGDGEVAQIIDVNEMLAGGTNPLLQGGPIGDAVGIQEGLEARAVAPFEKFDDQLRGGVLAKIRREVADANPSRTARSADRRWREGLDVAGDAATAQFANATLLRRRRIECDQREGG